VLVCLRELCRSFLGRKAHDSDHTIVSSDSLGSVTFWDGTSLAQKQSFQAHKADGMCMAIGPVSLLSLAVDEADGRTVEQCLLRVPTSEFVNSPPSLPRLANLDGFSPAPNGYIRMMSDL
jgi:hypothetical protein